MYVKRAQQQQQQQHSVFLGTSSIGGRTSPLPTHGASNPVVLQAPVVQHIRAANCRGLAGGVGGVGQSAAPGGGVARNEPHPLARQTATADLHVDVDDNTVTRSSTEASLRDSAVIWRVVVSSKQSYLMYS